MRNRNAVNLKRAGRKGSIRKLLNMERYYACITIHGVEYRTICGTLEEAEQWIDDRLHNL